jgi:hypothetical protein
MKSGRPIVVLNPYDWLPGHGENSIAVRSKGLDWVVEIEYDDRARNVLCKRELSFRGVCCFYQASFPGPSLLVIDCEAKDTLGPLVEYPESAAALAWREHFGNRRPIKHYAIWFMSENLVIQVFAEGFALTEAICV